MDRILEITDTAGPVSLTGLALRDGWSAEEGGAVLNASAGTVTFTDVVVADSDSQGEGGGIHHLHGRPAPRRLHRLRQHRPRWWRPLRRRRSSTPTASRPGRR